MSANNPTKDDRRIYKLRHTGPPPKAELDRIKAELKQHGAVAYDLWLPETQFLPHIIHQDEHIMGSIYGRYSNGTVGRGVLVATDQRVIFLDKKPGYMHYEELTFRVIGGVTHGRAGPMGVVVLHTRLGDFRLRTFNQKNATNFVDYIEAKCLQIEEMESEEEYDYMG